MSNTHELRGPFPCFCVIPFELWTPLSTFWEGPEWFSSRPMLISLFAPLTFNGPPGFPSCFDSVSVSFISRSGDVFDGSYDVRYLATSLSVPLTVPSALSGLRAFRSKSRWLSRLSSFRDSRTYGTERNPRLLGAVDAVLDLTMVIGSRGRRIARLLDSWPIWPTDMILSHI